MDYLSLLNKDLITIISIYLPYNSIKEFETFDIDYKLLISLKFPLIVTSDINNYNISRIYLNTLELSEKYNEFYISKEDDSNGIGGINDTELHPDILFELLPETFEYLTLNDKILPRIDIIAKYDNLKVFKYVLTHEDLMYEGWDELWDDFITDNSINILEFILSDDILKDKWIDLKKSIDFYFEKGKNLSLDTVKTLFKYIEFDNWNKSQLIEYYNSDNIIILEYILSKFDINKVDFIVIITGTLINIYNDNDNNNNYNFLFIFNYFRKYLSDKDIIRLYERLFDNNKQAELIFKLTLDPVIKNNYK